MSRTFVFFVVIVLLQSTLNSALCQERDRLYGECIPLSYLNSLKYGGESFKRLYTELPGSNQREKSLFLITEHGAAKSPNYPFRSIFDNNVMIEDTPVFFNRIIAGKGLPRVTGEFVDRRSMESKKDHLERVHQTLKRSLERGVPPIASLRLIAPNQDGKGNFTGGWSALVGHGVTVIQVQADLSEHQEGFTFSYIEPGDDRMCEGYLHMEKHLEFEAVRGKDPTVLGGSSFLVVSAPSLQMQSDRVPRYTRSLIILSFLTGNME